MNQFVALVLCVLPALAAPSPLVPVKKTTDAIPGRYIVTFKYTVGHLDGVSSVTGNIGSQSKVTHQWGFINGLAGTFTDADLEVLRYNPNVASIEQDGYAHTQSVVTQTDATWGLGRISSQTSLAGQDPNALSYAYNYDSSAGANTDVYIIDTAGLRRPSLLGNYIWCALIEASAEQSIANSFASPLPSGGYPDADGNGHGTHTAGTAVSGPYGVAKAANVYAVKVLSDSGSGSWSDVISGMDWVSNAATTSGRPSVASMSLGGGFIDSVNTAANNLVASGVTTVVAAGNSNADATNFSPASASSVITVGASDINDAKAFFSNFGAPLAIWGPGVNVISTWNDGGTNTISGTSMATPHVSGFSAYLLGLDSTLTPASVQSTIQSQALNGILSGIPDGTINALLNNGLF
ncbi:subtilisin-like protein [Thelephora ganbajun]|uniref:Subtilisin-like protein n=1 Tax=Thelephora ganbajun TaxID=370292 RepID=A0ACB6Z7H5_THEGA|nr:subtilisin-like protein [Thelephora ganbajun]